MNARFHYFFQSLQRALLGKGFACPSCGGERSNVLSRKYAVTTLRRCTSCSLLFRAPTTPLAESTNFYQADYESGFTTDIPDDKTLSIYLASNFVGTPKDFRRYISILKSLGCEEGDRLLDFGCSWGYGSWQFKNSGFDVIAYDVSRQRVEFAQQHLAISATSDIETLGGPIDIFFSAHVLEHLPSVGNTLSLASRLLREGGLFVSVTPNGSVEYRRKNPRRWNRSWGLKHPNLLDEEFYSKAFGNKPFLLTSDFGDADLLRSWSRIKTQKIIGLDGWEILSVFQNTHDFY